MSQNQKITINLFSNNACGIDGHAIQDNLLPLVKFAGKHTELSGFADESDLKWMHQQLIFLMQGCQDAEFLERGSVLVEQERPNLEEWYNLLLDKWDAIKGMTQTYRLLTCMVSVAVWKDSQEEWRELEGARTELLISGWNDQGEPELFS